tara:strand:+ start:929 stop:1513 length:585 start_codon:yes stop_codon:yes gene_type:complete
MGQENKDTTEADGEETFRDRDQKLDAEKQKEFESWATGLRSPADIAEERLLEKSGIDVLDAGGFKKRDAVRQDINRSVADEKRLKRMTNLAYRQRVKFGDLRGALEILKGAKRDNVQFGGISRAGATREKVIQSRAKGLRKRQSEVGEGDFAPREESDPPANVASARTSIFSEDKPPLLASQQLKRKKLNYGSA